MPLPQLNVDFLQEVANDLLELIKTCVETALTSPSGGGLQPALEVAGAWDDWMKGSARASSRFGADNQQGHQIQELQSLIAIGTQLQQLIEGAMAMAPELSAADLLQRGSALLSRAQTLLADIAAQADSSAAGKFEWVDGTLTR